MRAWPPSFGGGSSEATEAARNRAKEVSGHINEGWENRRPSDLLLDTAPKGATYLWLRDNESLASEITGSIIQRRNTAIKLLREHDAPEEWIYSFQFLHKNLSDSSSWELPENRIRSFPFSKGFDSARARRLIAMKRLKRLGERPDSVLHLTVDGKSAMELAREAVKGSQLSLLALTVGLSRIEMDASKRSESFAVALSAAPRNPVVSELIFSHLHDMGSDPEQLQADETKSFLECLHRSKL